VAVAMAELVYCLRFDVVFILVRPKAACHARETSRHVFDANVRASMTFQLDILSVRGTVSFARPLNVALERCGKPGGCEEEEEKGSRQLHIRTIESMSSVSLSKSFV
jgi:hypothetical protein